MGLENQEDEVNVAMNPEEIGLREFSSSLRGYDKVEVRDFLSRVAQEVGRLQDELSRPVAPPVADGERADIPEDWPLPADAAPVERAWGDDAVPEALRGPEGDAALVEPVADASEHEALAEAVADSIAGASDEISPADDWTTASFQDTPAAPVDEAPAPAFSFEPVVAETEAAPVVETEPVAQSFAGDSDDDRFQALGERIAGLLRNAHESASMLRESAAAEAAQTRESAAFDAEQTRIAARDEAAEMVAVAEQDAERVRSIATDDAQRIMDEANADATAKRDEANRLSDEARETLEQAAIDAAAMKEQAIVDGNAALDGRKAEIEAQEAAAQTDRETAMAELADAREQVSALLQEARTQSDFIRHEAEEIIRTKIRSNLEQAEQRLNVLRNSEVASRDRISKAHQELAGALSRLEAELPPELDANAEQLALDEAKAKGEATGYGFEPALEAPAEPATDFGTPVDAPVEAEVIETTVVDADLPTREAPSFGAPSFEA
ncbi:MAG: DivIVA domain-containing protein, partial [Acidimicrobiales bacterium]